MIALVKVTRDVTERFFKTTQKDHGKHQIRKLHSAHKRG